MAFWEMLQSIMGYGYPPPLWTDRLMDRRVSKHYLPVVLLGLHEHHMVARSSVAWRYGYFLELQEAEFYHAMQRKILKQKCHFDGY